MKIIEGIGQLKKPFKNTVVVIGVFDGLHRGHQRLMARAVKRAKAIGGTSMVMTFHPHPIHVLRPQQKMPLIISFPHRLKLMETYGIDVCLAIKFNKRFAAQTPEQFIKKYLVQGIQPKEVIVGEDFRFGHDREGTLNYFKDAGQQYGFKVHAIHAVKTGKGAISSTRIRALIQGGELAKARRLLGRPVSVFGHIVRGDRRGRELGFPTANIIPQAELIPPAGVYAVRVRFKNFVYDGAANVGRKPSFHKEHPLIIEVYILNFKGNLYGKGIQVEFIKKLRDERPFTSQEQLVSQIQKDIKTTQHILSTYSL